MTTKEGMAIEAMVAATDEAETNKARGRLTAVRNLWASLARVPTETTR